jgi:hypothetical protein
MNYSLWYTYYRIKGYLLHVLPLDLKIAGQFVVFFARCL